MPFTLSHPAAVLVFRKTKLPISALMLGAMTPDMSYFFLEKSEIGHTIPGLFVFCLPMGIIMYFLFHYFLKYPILDLFPDRHSAFLNSFVKNPELNSLKKIGLLLAALLVGATTHLAWDSCTHYNGWLVLHANWMQTLLFKNSFFAFKLYRFFQHLSTLIGGAVLLYFYWRSYKNRALQKYFEHLLRPGMRVLVVMLILILGLTLAMLLSWPIAESADSYILYKNLVYHFVIVTMETTAGAIGLYAVLWFVAAFIKKKATSRRSVTVGSMAVEEQ